jgi:uncharacterized protein YvpB
MTSFIFHTPPNSPLAIAPSAIIVHTLPAPFTASSTIIATSTIPDVPSYSQFKDIISARWQKVGCGITSLAMIIDYYSPSAVTVNTLLKQGIAAGAYDYSAGWIYQGLIDLSRQYGLNGNYHDLTTQSSSVALDSLKKIVKDGPAILSVHYKFDPKSTIPHLVVIDGIDAKYVYYNDPAAPRGVKQIAIADFLKGWKKKVIVIRPKSTTVVLTRTIVHVPID